MQEQHYKGVLYFIVGVILVTLGMQVYWNYINYQSGKQQLINDVQVSLDNAVDKYYTDLAEENILGVSFSDTDQKLTSKELDSLLLELEKPLKDSHFHDSMEMKVNDSGGFKSISIFTGKENSNIDTLFGRVDISKQNRRQLVQWETKKDSLKFINPFFELTTKVIFAITNDELKLDKLDSIVSSELKRKKIDVRYDLAYNNEKGDLERTNTEINLNEGLQTNSKSSYLPKETTLQLTFTDATLAILTRNLFSLLLSFVFMIAVIGCLLYLLKVIKHQKQLAEIKNDLISNITHEFKTPIATIGAAVEAIQTFNSENDLEKNQRYAEISSQQVGKLNVMVEKLLETATLDSDTLPLHFETQNLVTILERATHKEAIALAGKEISFSTSNAEILLDVDVFHFENAINNIIDNAIKYGGEKISVVIKNNTSTITISIQDNGTSLSKEHSKHLFEKFYRVPKGNTHNVKGFGIGLFYAKKIIEKHLGTIQLSTVPSTNFIITLPNGG